MKIQLQNHGSVVLAFPMDDEAEKWLHETAPQEAQFFGRALVIEPRYVEGFQEAFESAGGEVL